MAKTLKPNAKNPWQPVRQNKIVNHVQRNQNVKVPGTLVPSKSSQTRKQAQPHENQACPNSHTRRPTDGDSAARLCANSHRGVHECWTARYIDLLCGRNVRHAEWLVLVGGGTGKDAHCILQTLVAGKSAGARQIETDGKVVWI